YAGNIETHAPDGDIFNPEIKARIKSEGSGEITCKCPDCGGENVFSARKNPDGFEYDENGYYVDVIGSRIKSDYGDFPAHWGRRCANYFPVAGGRYERCGYMWTHKDCVHCGAPNDISVRRCSSCKGELINPGEKLEIAFRELKRDPYQPQSDVVVS